MEFEAGGQPYAVDAGSVLQVRESGSLSALPGHGDDVVGMVTLGEDVAPVLGVLGPVGRHVLVLTAGDEVFGLAVDEVTAVRSVDETLLAPPPPGPEGAFVGGVLRRGDALVLLVDPAALVLRLRGLPEDPVS